MQNLSKLTSKRNLDNTSMLSLILTYFKIARQLHMQACSIFCVNLQVEYRKSASLIESQMRLSSNMLTNQ